MGFRFRRSVRLLPGVRLNFGKRGVSALVGVRGAHVTVGKTGVRTTVGIPGTGLSYTSFRSVKRPRAGVRRRAASAQPWQSLDGGSPGPPISSRTYWLLGWVAATIVATAFLVAFFPQLSGDLAVPICATAVAAAMWTTHRIAHAFGRAAAARADHQAQVDAERRYTEQTGFPVVHPSSEDGPGITQPD